MNINSGSESDADDELSDVTDEDFDEFGIHKTTFMKIGQYMVELSNANNESSDSSISTSTSDEERTREIFLKIGKQIQNQNTSDSDSELIMEEIFEDFVLLDNSYYISDEDDDIFYLSN